MLTRPKKGYMISNMICKNNKVIRLYSESSTLKILDEFYRYQIFTNAQNTKRTTKKANNLYNEIRLHLSLDYKTTNIVYLRVRQAGKLSALK
jgi:hypothetical protein